MSLKTLKQNISKAERLFYTERIKLFIETIDNIKDLSSGDINIRTNSENLETQVKNLNTNSIRDNMLLLLYIDYRTKFHSSEVKRIINRFFNLSKTDDNYYYGYFIRMCDKNRIFTDTSRENTMKNRNLKSDSVLIKSEKSNLRSRNKYDYFTINRTNIKKFLINKR